MQNIEQHIQAIIFSSPAPVGIHDIQSTLQKTFEQEIDLPTIEAVIEDLISRFATDTFGFELKKTGGGFQFLSKSEYFKTIHNYINTQQKKKLSKSSLETLSIIAYNEGTTKSEIELIRGVASDYSIDKLLEKELIEIKGRAETPGRPLTYGTSEKFMHYFGIKNLNDLPKLKDFKEPENQIGAQQNNN